MPSYDFNVIIAAGKMNHKEILDATDALGEAGCTDASLCGHAEGMELQFTRSARSLQAAIASAIGDVESAGFRVIRVEMERDAIPTS
jgi:hypothetical protein